MYSIHRRCRRDGPRAALARRRQAGGLSYERVLQAAVHRHHLPGDLRRTVRRQEEHGLGLILRRDRRLGQRALGVEIRQLVAQRVRRLRIPRTESRISSATRSRDRAGTWSIPRPPSPAPAHSRAPAAPVPPPARASDGSPRPSTRRRRASPSSRPCAFTLVVSTRLPRSPCRAQSARASSRHQVAAHHVHVERESSIAASVTWPVAVRRDEDARRDDRC